MSWVATLGSKSQEHRQNQKARFITMSLGSCEHGFRVIFVVNRSSLHILHYIPVNSHPRDVTHDRQPKIYKHLFGSKRFDKSPIFQYVFHISLNLSAGCLIDHDPQDLFHCAG